LNTKKEILKYLTENKSAFKKEFGLIKIGLFGSYAKDQNNNLSDIDLIVEFEPDTEMLFEKKKILKAILRKRFSVEVDLCREKYIKKYYRKQILKSAIYV
jgi:predicted nucleotidyltransferase